MRVLFVPSYEGELDARADEELAHAVCDELAKARGPHRREPADFQSAALWDLYRAMQGAGRRRLDQLRDAAVNVLERA